MHEVHLCIWWSMPLAFNVHWRLLAHIVLVLYWSRSWLLGVDLLFFHCLATYALVLPRNLVSTQNESIRWLIIIVWILAGSLFQQVFSIWTCWSLLWRSSWSQTSLILSSETSLASFVTFLSTWHCSPDSWTWCQLSSHLISSKGCCFYWSISFENTKWLRVEDLGVRKRLINFLESIVAYNLLAHH